MVSVPRKREYGVVSPLSTVATRPPAGSSSRSQRVLAALEAILRRSSALSRLARARPPLLAPNLDSSFAALLALVRSFIADLASLDVKRMAKHRPGKHGTSKHPARRVAS